MPLAPDKFQFSARYSGSIGGKSKRGLCFVIPSFFFLRRRTYKGESFNCLTKENCLGASHFINIFTAISNTNICLEQLRGC